MGSGKSLHFDQVPNQMPDDGFAAATTTVATTTAAPAAAPAAAVRCWLFACAACIRDGVNTCTLFLVVVHALFGCQARSEGHPPCDGRRSSRSSTVCVCVRGGGSRQFDRCYDERRVLREERRDGASRDGATDGAGLPEIETAHLVRVRD